METPLEHPPGKFFQIHPSTFVRPKRAFSALRAEKMGGETRFRPPQQLGVGGGDRPPPLPPPLMSAPALEQGRTWSELWGAKLQKYPA